MRIALAYRALAQAFADRLVAVAFLADADKLAVDPASPVETSGEPDEVLTAAELVELETAPAPRRRIGGATHRWIVERQVQLALACASPDAAWRESTFDAALTTCAALPAEDPTLGGRCERLELLASDPDDFPPNGVKTLLTFVLRVRSGDPLGLTD